VDREEHYSEVFGEEKVQEDATARIPVKTGMLRVAVHVAEHPQDPNVRKASDLLGVIIQPDPVPLHEIEVRGHMPCHPQMSAAHPPL
jgi:hypothetical protein